MKKLILITLLAFTLTSCLTTEKCKAQDYIDWFGNPEPLGYGALYNWYAASDSLFAPAGWHLPTETEGSTLITYLGGAGAGGKLKETGTTHWNSPNTGATNETGFNGRGAGDRAAANGSFNYIQTSLGLRTTTSDRELALSYNSANAYQQSSGDVKRGRSVRLIKDDSTDTGTLTDYDGNVYNTVKIGDQVWIASNWKCEHLNDGTAIPITTDNTAWAALTTMGMCFYGNDRNNR